ncbi:glycosyltransferase family 4 protein [Hymenobacter psychrotolerans]|uniref:Glycosyltransferase involved in cell wall bisynthesis n=1 Tax=Hymenobacter psychrotolerans DSM 18569 TaxID=1121959 RepID=A0A1M6NWU8_9BACT|nr:glycosyltransferase family 4 protein [Hymenobacter psychrotolerans]SHK00163.1 Glycosyltransferase involved in cell wall bisynthesis [Hymenobacter psychrotolerans DSM 18569]
MHVAVFSQYHTNPDCPATSRHYSLLAHLARKHRVTLITTRTWERQRLTQQFPWVPEGVELRAADVPYENRMGVARRGLAFGQYAAYALREGLRIDRPDVIWGISTPLTAAWAAAQVAAWRKVPWVFEVQDLWPSFPISMGAVPSRWAQRQLFALEKSLYCRAQHIMALSPDMTSYVENVLEGSAPDASSKTTTVLNGTDLELAATATDAAVEALRQEQGLEGCRVVLYAGTLGRANDIPTLLAAAELLSARVPKLIWLFLGLGYDEPRVREAAARCPAIRLVPPQPRHAVFNWFRLAEVSVVSFLGMPVLDTNSPAKFYDSLAVGTPVVVTNCGWTRQLVEKHGCGWYSPASDAPALAALLGRLLEQPDQLAAAGQAGRMLAATSFDRTTLATEVTAILEQARGH